MIVLLYIQITDSYSPMRSPANAIFIFKECDISGSSRFAKLVFLGKIAAARIRQLWASTTCDINSWELLFQLIRAEH